VAGTTTIPQDETSLAGQSVAIISGLDTRISGNAILGADFTIQRIRGFYNVFPTAINVTNFVTGAIGACVVNGEAFDAGVAAVIDPYTEAFDDRWLWHEYFSMSALAVVGGTNAELMPVGGDRNIDNKAQRKMSTGDVMIFVLSNASTDALSFFFNARVLIKLA